MIHQKTIELSDGRTIVLETGKLARQADGSVVLKQGNTMLLATIVSSKNPIEEVVDFLPLSVEYREKFAAIGRFPGGFMKRESKPSDNEILVSRLIDRALRPLFPDNYHAETFVTVYLISADKETSPDSLAGLAASAAISVSDIPFNGPISEVRVARINGELKINPPTSELANADIDMIVAASIENIVMVEGEMNEASEQDMIEAIKFAHDTIKIQCQAQIEFAAEVGAIKREYSHEINDETLKIQVREFAYDKVLTIARLAIADKKKRTKAFDEIKEEFVATIPEITDEQKALIDRYYHDIHKEAVRNMILDEQIRLDGRKTEEIRPIWCEVDYLPSAHGSAVFTRGETQSLTTVTLGTKLDEKTIDEVLNQGSDKFLLHYNFPPFSTNEAKPMRAPGRREIGHGNLAHRALKRMIPSDPEANPYAIRIVSDILESNGSSSMATVCAGTLALMDAGVKMSKPVSGIAMGLITDNSGRYAVLSDILGDEDHLGDMDFKVTGTADGITATQMDLKVNGLSYEVMAQALEQARKGRLHILGKILETIAEPRSDYKPTVPRYEKMFIPKEMIGAVIGTGGKTIQQIQADTGATIVIEEIDNKGLVDIFATNLDAIQTAVNRIKAIIEVPEVGKVYKGIVKQLAAFGAFVEIIPGKDGLLHVSEIDHKHVRNVEDVLSVGQEIEVKLIEIEKNGKMKLSRKALLPRPQGMPQQTGNERHNQHGHHEHSPSRNKPYRRD